MSYAMTVQVFPEEECLQDALLFRKDELLSCAKIGGISTKIKGDRSSQISITCFIGPKQESRVNHTFKYIMLVNYNYNY